MKTKETLEQERGSLAEALRNNLITNIEYQDLYYALSQKIKRFTSSN